MSSLKFTNELFLDNLELKRFSRFIFEDGWEKILAENTASYGIVKNPITDNTFDYFRVVQGTPISGNATIQMSEGFAVAFDPTVNKVRFIRNYFTSPIPFPQDGNWYWIKIKPKYNPFEIGKVSVDTAGNLVGTGCKFTEVLRGQPGFPSRIKFYKLQSDQLTTNPSTLNPIEYDVLQVIDDNNAILQGSFQNETDLYYTVIGTFTPGYVVPTNDKQIFQYDDCEISIVQENLAATLPTKPSYIINSEFFIYRVRYDSGNLIIQDYRNELFKLRSDFNLEFMSNDKSPLFGIESIEYNNDLTPLDKNLVQVGWGFRSNSYTVNLNLNKITVTGGNGGKIKTPNDFSTGNFDNWRLYVLDYVRNSADLDSYSNKEKYFIVQSSVKNGTNIDLFIDRASMQDFMPAAYNNTTAYSNNDKVSIANIFYKLLTSSATGISPSQPTWSIGTTYVLNDLISYGDGVYQSLSNGNTGNQPDTSPTFWLKVWETFIPKISIVPDVEEVIVSFEVGSDVDSSIADPSSTNREYVRPVFNGVDKFEVVAVNDNVITQPIYNVKYRYKNNKVFSPKYVPLSDSVGYVNELGSTISYSVDYNKAFIKVIKSPNAYSNFVNRIDLNDNFGVEFISDLEAVAAVQPGRLIPFLVGTRKQNVEITGSSGNPLTGVTKLNLLTTNAKSGSRFFIYFNGPISNGQTLGSAGFDLQLVQDGSTVLYTFTQDEVNKNKQLFICTYDVTLNLWEVIHVDDAYNGDSAYKPGVEVVSTAPISSGGNVDSSTGANILVISGYYETVVISNVSATPDPFNIEGVRTLNGKQVNNLKLENNALSPSNGQNIKLTEDYTISPPVGVLKFYIPDGIDNIIKSGQIFTLVNDRNGYRKVADTNIVKAPVLQKTGDTLATPVINIPNGSSNFGLGVKTITTKCLATIMYHIRFSTGTSTTPGINPFLNLHLYVNGVMVDESGFGNNMNDATAYELNGTLSSFYTAYLNAGDIIELKADWVDVNAGYSLDIRWKKFNIIEMPY